MAGLKGLKKGERLEIEAQAESFIVGAKSELMPYLFRQRKYVRECLSDTLSL